MRIQQRVPGVMVPLLVEDRRATFRFSEKYGIWKSANDALRSLIDQGHWLNAIAYIDEIPDKSLKNNLFDTFLDNYIGYLSTEEVIELTEQIVKCCNRDLLLTDAFISALFPRSFDIPYKESTWGLLRGFFNEDRLEQLFIFLYEGFIENKVFPEEIARMEKALKECTLKITPCMKNHLENELKNRLENELKNLENELKNLENELKKKRAEAGVQLV